MNITDVIAECLEADASTDENSGGTGVVESVERVAGDGLVVRTTDGRSFAITVKEQT